MGSSQRTAVRAAADAAKGPMLAAARVVGVSTVTVKIRPFQSSETGAAAAVKYGPNAGYVHIRNDRTQPHIIARKGGGSLKNQNLVAGRGARRRSYRAGKLLLGALSQAFGGPGGKRSAYRGPINIKGIGPRAYANHPGTKGKHFTERGITAGARVATEAYMSATRAAYGKELIRG